MQKRSVRSTELDTLNKGAMSMTLYYFPIPGAPGELTRMVLTLGDFDWKVGAPKLHASSRRAQYIYIYR